MANPGEPAAAAAPYTTTFAKRQAQRTALLRYYRPVSQPEFLCGAVIDNLFRIKPAMHQLRVLLSRPDSLG